jgi:diacylglycerol O-acyltransferase / wax synthase
VILGLWKGAVVSAQRVSHADAAWLHMDRATNLMVVNALLWFEEPVDADRVKEILRARLVEPFPRFRQLVMEPRLGVGVPSWKDDPNFDLDLHVHHLAVPAPGDKRALEELVGDLISSPLDRGKPLWDWYLVDGFGGGMAMVVRIHHCIADGIALSHVLLSLTDTHADAGIASARDGAGRGLFGSIAAPVKAGARLAQAGVHEGIEILTHPTAELPALASRGTVAGSKIAAVVAWVPAAGTIGIGIDMMSYNGGVTVSLQVDARLIPDPNTIIADYEREIDTLRRLAPRHRTRTATPN